MYRKQKRRNNNKYVCTNYPTNTYLPNITDLNQMNNGANMKIAGHASIAPASSYNNEKVRPMDSKCKKRDPCCVQKYNGHQPSVIFPGCYPPEKKKACIDPCVPRCMKLGVCKTLLSRPCNPCGTCCMGPDCYIVPRQNQYSASPMVFPCSKSFRRVYK
mgnify:FL=1